MLVGKYLSCLRTPPPYTHPLGPQERKFFGLSRDNIYIISAPRMPDFRFDERSRVLVPDERSQVNPQEDPHYSWS